MSKKNIYYFINLCEIALDKTVIDIFYASCLRSIKIITKDKNVIRYRRRVCQNRRILLSNPPFILASVFFESNAKLIKLLFYFLYFLSIKYFFIYSNVGISSHLNPNKYITNLNQGLYELCEPYKS